MRALDLRYTRSPDGTSIAYTEFGTGPRLVVVPPIPFSNVAGDLAVPLLQEVYEELAKRFALLFYDGRGTGASQRSVADFTTAALASDLATALDAVGSQRAGLLAQYTAAAPALHVAARQPERVTRVVLFGAVSAGRTALDRPGTSALLNLVEEDWELFTKTAALDWMGWGVGESGDLVARSFRSATTPSVARAALEAFAASDVGPLLRDVLAPTLVLHRRDSRQLGVEESAALASRLRDGRLHILEGASATLFFDDPARTVELITRFMRPGHQIAMKPTRTGESSALTAREREVLRHIAAGDSNQEIASRLGVSVHTVERHAANIYRKIDARGRADATAWALRNGLG